MSHVQVSWIRSNKSSYDVSAPAEKNENDDEANMVFRHAYANLFSKMSYWWFGTQILQVGYKKPLQQSDLGPIPKVCVLKFVVVNVCCWLLFYFICIGR